MTDQMQGLREDVAFMRGLAEDGRDTPLGGGSIGAAAGALFGLASLATYAVLKRWTGLDYDAIGWFWLAAGVLFTLALITDGRSRAAKRRTSAANRANSAAWTGAGFAIFAIFGAFILASVRTDEWIVMTLLAPVILGFYAAAWSVAGAMTGRLWMKLTAGAALVLAVLMGWMAGTAEQYLLYAFALFGTALVPGLVMMRQVRAARGA